MISVIFFSKRSLFVVLLVSYTVNPLIALPIEVNSKVLKSNQKSSIFSNEVENILIDRGLEVGSAKAKIRKLFQNNKNIDYKLQELCTENLSVTKEKLVEKLAMYALQEKKLDLNSYTSLIGLMQSVSLKILDKNELEHIEYVASLS